jgi:hypothetical protein
VLVRTLAIRNLAELPAPERDPDGGRNLVCLLRDALDHANLPAQVYARLLAGFSVPGADSTMWTDPARLGAFVVPAALGGHEGARRVLTTWCDPGARSRADRTPEVRQIIGYRLQRRVGEGVDALGYLIADARTAADPRYLALAFDEMDDAEVQACTTYAQRLEDLIDELAQVRRRESREYAYRLWARTTGLLVSPPGGERLVQALRTERDPGVVNALLDIVTKAVERVPDRWPGTDYEALVTVLVDLAAGRGVANPTIAIRSTVAVRDVVCRTGPVSPRRAYARTLALVDEYILTSTQQQAARPLGYLMSRLARAAPDEAAALLAAASRSIAAIGGPAASWKTRRARQWRLALADVITALPVRSWRRLMVDLLAGDPRLFIQAVDVSLQSRRGHPEEDVARILADGGASADLQQAFLAARRRHQRIVGGLTTWPELLATP